MNKEPPESRDSESGDAKLTPLPGEPGIPSVGVKPQIAMSKRGLIAIGFAVLSLGAVSAVSIQRFATSAKGVDDGASKRAGDRPASASIEPKKLDLLPATASSAPVARSGIRIPAIAVSEDDDPIGVRRSEPTTAAPPAVKGGLPEDAPALLVSSRPGPVSASRTVSSLGLPESEAALPADPLEQTRRNLDAYQRQLQVLLDRLTKGTVASSSLTPGSTASSSEPVTAPSPAPGSGSLFGGQLPISATPRVSARLLGDRSLVLPKGTAFTCALKTRVISAASGLLGCLVQRNVYSDDGRVLLIERGSHMDGEYRIASVKPGTVRIPVVWTRIRTPNGVTIDVDSPGTGPLGESGIDGYVDNRWRERIGAALLLSLIDDSVQLALQHESNASTGNGIVLPATTGTGTELAEKVLDSTINIPPLIYQNQGGIVGIYVAQDVDFSSVYELKPAP